MQVEVIRDRALLGPLRSDWDALARCHGTPLLGFDWFVCALDTLHVGDRPCIVLVREAGVITAVAPLCTVRENGRDILQLPGTTALYEPCGFLYADERSLGALVDAVLALAMPVVLLRMPDDPTLHAALRRARGRRAIILGKRTAAAAYLPLPQTVDELHARLSANRRYDFKRKRKCLEKIAPVAIRIINPTPAELPPLLNEALRIEDAGWKGREGSSLVKNDRLRGFFLHYCERACAAGTLRLCFLDVGDRPVAMHIAIEADDALWILKLGHDAVFDKCSPGVQLAMETVEYSVRAQLRRYEFLGSEEAWQQAWPIERRTYFTYLVYPYSVAGMSALARFFVVVVRKRLGAWLVGRANSDVRAGKL